MQLNGLQVFKILLAPANEVCEGYVFTGVCLSTGGGSPSGGSLSRGGGLCQGDPPDRDPPYSNEQAVRILLECILVFGIHLNLGK